MEGVILLGIVLWLCSWAYSSGKQTGSRKGFGVGREQGKRLR